jgi:hypothetical protein
MKFFSVGICTQKCYDDGVSFPKGKREKKKAKGVSKTPRYYPRLDAIKPELQP